MNPERLVSRLVEDCPWRLPALAADLVETMLRHAEEGDDYVADRSATRIVEAIRAFDRGQLSAQELRIAADEVALVAREAGRDSRPARIERAAALAGDVAVEAATDYHAMAGWIRSMLACARELGVPEVDLDGMCFNNHEDIASSTALTDL